MPKRDYASKLYAQKGDALKLYASKGVCLMTVCPKGTMPYDCMPKNCMPKGDMPFDWMPIYCPAKKKQREIRGTIHILVTQGKGLGTKTLHMFGAIIIKI